VLLSDILFYVSDYVVKYSRSVACFTKIATAIRKQELLSLQTANFIAKFGLLTAAPATAVAGKHLSDHTFWTD